MGGLSSRGVGRNGRFPALQADIEQHLHEARTLITQAQEAAERGNERQVQLLVSQVKDHTTKAIEGSKEQKK